MHRWVATSLILALNGCTSPPLTADLGVAPDRAADSFGAPPAAEAGPGSTPLTGPCEGNNFEDSDVTGAFAGGALFAISWTPARSVIVSRLEVFTGHIIGSFMDDSAVGIWSDDGGTPSAPLAPLGFSPPFQPAVEFSWQGADLVTPVAVTAATPYWFVWDTSRGWGASVTDDPAAVQQTYWTDDFGTIAGGGTWSGGPFFLPDRRFRFRMFCAPTSHSVPLDIKPGSCPNPLSCRSQGVLPAAILGSADFDPTEIDVSSILLGGVPPIRFAVEDVAGPFFPLEGRSACDDCTHDGPDGYADLTLKFDRQAIVAAIGEAGDGSCIRLSLTGTTSSGSEVAGEDVVRFQCP